MSDIVIKAEDICKLYGLGEIGTGTISHDLNRWWARLMGKEDPFAKVGEVNDRTLPAGCDFIWALKDVNFEVKRGEVLGIIGRNGAGKSTLLKLLSKVTTPTSGKIMVKGRIASLLEVGTGFHPELTGRENIFMNGSILGMRRAEIQSKFDEIVDFAGVERYIDTPVKRYSSGMYMRLAFSVAAFLEQEILIVDEVLAVGDAEFQRKCLGRIKDASYTEGRTVLFVSHNMASLRAICNNAILLHDGMIKIKSDISSVLKTYSQLVCAGVPLVDSIKYFSNLIRFNSISINHQTITSVLLDGDSLLVIFSVELFDRIQLDLDLHIKQDDFIVASFGGFTQSSIPVLEPGTYNFNCFVKLPNLRTGLYKLDLSFTQPYTRWWAVLHDAIELEVQNHKNDTFINSPSLPWGKVLLNGEISIESV